MKKILFSVFFLIISIKVLTVTTGCANIIQPTGGPRDSLPPVLIGATPRDSVKHFAGKKLTFVFNEYVQLDNPQQNVLVSPVPKVSPFIEAKLRTVTITLKDTLEENTTYSFNFGNSLKDINEGNTLKDFNFIFSTGSYLDSLTLSGKVLMAQSGQPDSTLVVMLYPSADDSAVIKDKPRYVARLDHYGRFEFSNLPAQTYSIYALKDEGGSRKYLSKAQAFAFYDKRVTTSQPNDSIVLFAYVDSAGLINPSSGSSKSPIAPPSQKKGADAAAAAQDKRLKYETNLQDGKLNILGNLEIKFPLAPLRTVDTTLMKLTTENFDSIANYSIIKDTSNRKLTVTYNWQENTGYHLLLEKDFAEDTLGKKALKADTVSFKTKKNSEYGLVRLRFPNLDLSKNPVLQFIQNDAVQFSYKLQQKEFFAKLFIPGDYELRMLYDENNNGKWDPGSFFGVHRQPERVIPIPAKLTVKANWDNQTTITL